MSSLLHNENGLPHLTEHLHLSQLYSSLEQLIYIQVAVLYYQDNSFLNLVLRWLLSTNFVPPTAAALHRVPVILAFNALITLIHLFSSSPNPTSSSSRGFVNGSVLIDFVGEFAHASRFKLLWQDVLLLALQILMLVVGSLKTKASEEPKESPQDLDAEEQGIRRVDGEPNISESGDIEMQSLLPGTVPADVMSTTIEINVMQEVRHIMRSNQELQNRIRSGDEVALRTLLAAVATNRARQQNPSGDTAPTTTTTNAAT